MLLKKCAAAAAVSLVFFAGHAQANDWTTEYEKKIKASQDVGVLGPDLAGDSTNFYTGATSFHVTDVSLPTNGMGISIGRSFEVEYSHTIAAVKGTLAPYEPEYYAARKRLFGDWDLDVPHISTVMSQEFGWVVDTTTPTKRCSVVGQKDAAGNDASGRPPMLSGTKGWHFPAYKYWHGYSLHAGGDQSMLLAPVDNSQRPATGGPYHWNTNQDWWISCTATIANGDGEGFKARSPEGVTYTFNWLSKRNIDSVTDKEENKEVFPGSKPSYLFRAEYLMLPTSVVDRFGNWVTYTWSNDEFARLLSVSAGPLNGAAEQTITLTYDGNGHVATVSDGTRTWYYIYTSTSDVTPLNGAYSYDRLTQVTLPDQTKWLYTLGSIEAQQPVCYIDPQIDPNSPEYYWGCWGGGDIQTIQIGGQVTHPSGAVIDYTFSNRYQYSMMTNTPYPLGLISKKITGPGLSAATWKFNFMESKEQAKADCQANNCPSELAVDQLNPDNSIIRRVFGIGPADQTVLLSTLEGSIGANGGGSPTITTGTAFEADALAGVAPDAGAVPTWYRKTTNTYAGTDSGQQYRVRVGVNPYYDGILANTYASERRLPVVRRDVTQQGVTFTTVTNSFNVYARPLSTTRSSVGSAGGNNSRTDLNEYSDNTLLWVLQQPSKLTTNGIVVSETTYDASTALPTSTKSFGAPPSTIAYNPNGTIASVSDGRGKTTQLSGWTRGTPQTITYPTGATETAVVNAIGNLSSTTDELGSATTYSYDLLGRLNTIGFPAGDTVAWNPLARTFAPVATSEYGIPAGHWKQTVKTGTAAAGYGQTTTFYDGRWQPVLTLTEDTALGSSKSFVVRRFDGMGRQTFASYPVSSATVADALPGTVTEYDALGRVIRVKQDSDASAVLTTSTSYLSGFQTQVTNPRGYSTTTSYQLFDAPSTDAPVSISAPEGVNTTIVRDVFGKPLSITRSGPGG